MVMKTSSAIGRSILPRIFRNSLFLEGWRARKRGDSGRAKTRSSNSSSGPPPPITNSTRHP